MAKRRKIKIKNQKRTRSIKPKINKANIVLILITVAMLIIGYILINQGINYEKNLPSIYNYTAQKSENYEVLLKPNDFYTSKTLPSGRYYASKSIEAFIINFQYDLNSSQKTNIKYTYNITAELIGTINTNENQDEEIWNRTFTLLENNNNETNAQQISIKQGINLDYQYYNDLARAYEKTYGIAIDSLLKIHFNITYNIDLSNLNEQTETKEDNIELEIPLTDTTTELRENYEKITSNNIKSKSKTTKIIYYTTGTIFITGAIILIIKKIKQIKNQKTPETEYKQTLKYILKYYNDLIVTIENEPDLTNLKQMKLTNLYDLIDVADLNQTNIIHYEKLPNQQDNFYTIIKDYVYIYETRI